MTINLAGAFQTWLAFADEVYRFQLPKRKHLINISSVPQQKRLERLTLTPCIQQLSVVIQRLPLVIRRRQSYRFQLTTPQSLYVCTNLPFGRTYKIYRFQPQQRQYLCLTHMSPKPLLRLQFLSQTSISKYQQQWRKLRLSLHRIHIQSSLITRQLPLVIIPRL
jgi:hypothetical protein